MPLDGEETQGLTNVLKLHHVALQAKLEEAQKLAMNVFNKFNHHVDALKDSIPLHGNVTNVNPDSKMIETPTFIMLSIST